jgi:glycine dehydrogenase
VLNGGKAPGFSAESLAGGVTTALGSFERSSSFMQQPIFNSYHW